MALGEPIGYGFTTGPFGSDDADKVIEGYDYQFSDNDYLRFGDLASTGDANLGWDGTNLNLLPAVDDTGTFNIGNGTLDFDVKIFLGDTSNYVQFDVGNKKVYFFGTPDGENSRKLHIDLEPTGAEMRRGGLTIDIWRSSSFTWAGSPDVAIKTSVDSDATNASGGAIRSIDTTARNRGAALTWCHGIHAGVRNDSGGACPELIGLSTRVENYGTMATKMIGVDVNLSCESDTGAGTKTGILVRNTDQSAQTAVDEVMKISHTSTNGFDYLLNFAGTSGDGIASGTVTGSSSLALEADARIAIVWNGTNYWIPCYNTAA